MALIYASIACVLLQTAAAIPNPFPLPTALAQFLPRQEPPLTSNTTSPIPTTTLAPTGGTLTGEFTGADGNVYDITSISGYVQVAGHTLSPGGGDALVGNIDVTAGSFGFVANGQTIAFMSVTSSSMTPVMTTSSEMAMSSSSMAASSSMASAAASSSSSTAGGSVATGVPMAGAVLGGLMGVLLL